MLSIPQSLTEITPRWLTSAFRSSGILDRGAVVSCTVQSVGEDAGFASRVARVELVYDSVNHHAPTSVIVKLPTFDPDQQRSDQLREKYRREAAFYAEFGQDAGIRVPRCYYVTHDPDSASFVLVLEDLSGGRFGDAAQGWSADDAALVIDGLATLHARWWDEPRLSGLDWLPSFASTADEQLTRFVQRRETFLRRHGQALPREVEQLTDRIGPGHEPLIERLAGPPETLLHVDTHLDNLVFLGRGQDTELVVFDWQGVARGLGVVDLALFLTCASPTMRREHEADLMGRYHRGLVARGVRQYPLEQLMADYRVAILRWWIGTVNGLGSGYAGSWSGRQEELARQSVERLSAIVSDHRVGDLL